MRFIPSIIFLACAIFCGAQNLRAADLTVRTRSDLRLWETVMERAQPLAWPWVEGADQAVVTFSNCLTRAVSSVTVTREAGALRGSCAQPVAPSAAETLVTATLVQTGRAGELVRATAQLAYLSGAGGGAITVRAKSDRTWGRVPKPRFAAFDASWWGADGPTGHEVHWITPAGTHSVVREFDNVGAVDSTLLFFGQPGFCFKIR